MPGLASEGEMQSMRDAGDDTEGAEVEVQEDAASEFEDGTRMQELADSGAVKIGPSLHLPYAPAAKTASISDAESARL